MAAFTSCCCCVVYIIYIHIHFMFIPTLQLQLFLLLLSSSAVLFFFAVPLLLLLLYSSGKNFTSRNFRDISIHRKKRPQNGFFSRFKHFIFIIYLLFLLPLKRAGVVNRTRVPEILLISHLSILIEFVLRVPSNKSRVHTQFRPVCGVSTTESHISIGIQYLHTRITHA